MIRYIHLINWRSHANTVLKFREGTNLIIGIMGSGKSSVMDGISFGLFGTFPSLESRRTKISDLFRHNSERALIEIEIEWDGKTYLIKRKIEKKGENHSSDALLYVETKLIEKGNKAVTQYVEQLLGIDYELFTRAIYSEQNSIDYFLTLSPKRRKEEFDSLLGLDKFENARANLTTLINRYKTKKNALGTRFEENKLEEYLKQLKENKEKKEKLQFSEERLKEEVELNKKRIMDSEKKLIELREKSEKNKRLEEEEVRINAGIKFYKERIKGKIIELKKIKNLEKDAENLEKEVKLIREKEKEGNKEIAELNKRLGEMESILERKNRLLEFIKKIKEEGVEDIEKMRKDKKNIEEELVKNEVEERTLLEENQEIEELIERVKKGRENCPFCGSGLNEEKIMEISEEKTGRKKENLQRIKLLREDDLEKKKRLHVLEKKITLSEGTERKKEMAAGELNKIKIERCDIEKLKAGLRKEIKEYDELGKILNEKVGKLNETKNEIEELQELIKIMEKLKEFEIKIEKVVEEKNELNFEEQELRESEKETQEMKIRFEKIKNEIETVKKELEYLERILTALEENVKSMEKIKEQIRKFGRREEELIIYKNTLKEVQTSLRDELIESINIAMNEIWGIFYPYDDYEKLRVRVNENDYNFEVYDGEWKTLEGLVSGGERACVALTLRVALSTVLTPNLSWLILDEPTHNLDRETIQLLSETLQIKVPSIIKQIFVITHEELLLGANFSMSYKLKRDKNSGEATQVELL